MRADWARWSHLLGERKAAAVCSFPPSWVGGGMTVSWVSGSVEIGEDWERGSR